MPAEFRQRLVIDIDDAHRSLLILPRLHALILVEDLLSHPRDEFVGILLPPEQRQYQYDRRNDRRGQMSAQETVHCRRGPSRRFRSRRARSTIMLTINAVATALVGALPTEGRSPIISRDPRPVLFNYRSSRSPPTAVQGRRPRSAATVLDINPAVRS